MNLKIVIFTLLVTLLASNGANANLISNGDFENGVNSWYGDYLDTWEDTANGNNSALLSEGVMWQSFSTTAWMRYMLSFSFKSAPGSAASQFVNVTIFSGSTLGNILFDGNIEVTNASEWMSYSTKFQAMSNTSVVRFSYNPSSLIQPQSINVASSDNVLIDDVQVAQVDEPLTVFLMSLGVVLLMFKRRSAA